MEVTTPDNNFPFMELDIFLGFSNTILYGVIGLISIRKLNSCIMRIKKVQQLWTMGITNFVIRFLCLGAGLEFPVSKISTPHQPTTPCQFGILILLWGHC